MEIRPARPCDRRAVGRMTARTWRWGDYIMGVWRDWVSGERGRLFVAEESGRIVGIMYVEFRGRETYLAGARVAPEARGRGVGTALTERCLEEARRAGAEYVTLITAEDNAPARRVAEKLGFRPEFFFRRFWAPALRRPSGSARLVPPEEGERILERFLERMGRLVLFSDWDWRGGGLEDVKRYCEEGFCAEEGGAAALYAPYFDRRLMVDAVVGGSEDLARFLRWEAHAFGCERVFGFSPDEEALGSMARAGYRVRKRTMVMYRLDL